jgi:hypothetical protein
MTAIEKILQQKNGALDELLSEFGQEFEKLSKYIKPRLAQLIRAGVPTREAVVNVFNESGYEGLVQEFVDKYDEFIKYGATLGKEIGIPLVLTDRSLSVLELIKEAEIGKMLSARESIVNTMVDIGLRREIEGASLRNVIADIELGIDELGRRIGAEAHTGASIFDRAIKSEQFKEAGIETFVYVGPDDEVTRDECSATLADPRQHTGWTRDDIDASQVSFIGGGGYNCRHEWLPFVKEVDALV